MYITLFIYNVFLRIAGVCRVINKRFGDIYERPENELHTP